MISALGGPGGNRNGGGILRPVTMRTIDPLRTMGPSERQMLDAKRGILRSDANLKTFASAASLTQLVSAFAVTARQLFPEGGIILLGKKGTEYKVVYREGIDFDLQKLNLSAPNSLVRAAGEVDDTARRTIYIPDLTRPGVCQASEFDTVVGSRMERNHHELEEGTMEEAGLTVDLISLKGAGLEAVAVAPVLEYKHTEPVGAIILTGKQAFLNPLIDLVALRELADQIAKPLKQKLA